MAEYLKPLPEPNKLSKTYWEACKEKRLVIQHCRECGAYIFYPRALCPGCMSSDLEWKEVSGKGTVYSFSVVHRPLGKPFADDVPYTVAIVELAEGPRMMSNLKDVDPQKVRVGMPVQVSFEEVTEEITLPKFVPA